jgi:hypothetical protein
LQLVAKRFYEEDAKAGGIGIGIAILSDHCSGIGIPGIRTAPVPLVMEQAHAFFAFAASSPCLSLSLSSLCVAGTACACKLTE